MLRPSSDNNNREGLAEAFRARLNDSANEERSNKTQRRRCWARGHLPILRLSPLDRSGIAKKFTDGGVDSRRLLNGRGMACAGDD